MPKLLRARAPQNAEEEYKIRKLARSRHAPGDWIARARIISLSWQGLRTAKIAEELGCHPQTVRRRLHRFNTEGIDGLGDRPGAGRRARITEQERSKIIALVSKEPPGRLEAISQTLSEQNQDTAELRHTQEVLILALVADYQPPEVL